MSSLLLEVSSSGQLFEFLGCRELVSAEKAALLLDSVTVNDPHVIRLSNKSFTSDAAKLISQRLSTFKNVKVADISDIIAGRPEDDALLTL